MKVLQTIPSLQVSWGGPSTCTCDLLEGLYDVNANVDLLTSDAACADDVVLGKGRPWMKLVEHDWKTPIALSKNIKSFCRTAIMTCIILTRCGCTLVI